MEASTLARGLFCLRLLLATGCLAMLPPPAVAATLTVPALVDEFLVWNPSNWALVSGSRTVVGGVLTLVGGAAPNGSRAEIRSQQGFTYGLLQMAITSSAWKPNTQPTDSSFGFEVWSGTGLRCHYAVVLIANGHLGLLQSRPAATGVCTGDPVNQAYVPISNWETLRAERALKFTVVWAPGSVTLQAIGTRGVQGVATYRGIAEPTNTLKIRLNADLGETYRLDYVRTLGIPWR